MTKMKTDSVVYKNVSFDKENKTFTILKGTEGVYSYPEIASCKAINENAKSVDKQDASTNGVADSLVKVGKELASNIDNFPTNIYVEVQVVMKDEKELYICISDKETSMNTLDFHKDRDDAKDLVKFIKKIIEKYK